MVRRREGGSQLVMNFDFFLGEFEVLRVKLGPFLDHCLAIAIGQNAGTLINDRSEDLTDDFLRHD